MVKKVASLLFLMWVVVQTTFAAVGDIAKDEYLLQGFAKKVSGSDLQYHSHLSDMRTALLIRAKDGLNKIEWETEAVPENLSAKYVKLVWNAGISSLIRGKEKIDFSIEVNGKALVSFQNGIFDDFTVDGENGTQLSFKKMLKDGAEDCFGYMFLRIPAAMVEPGKVLHLSMKAENRNSESWAMVFQVPVVSGKLVATPIPALTKKDGMQMVRVEYCHFGKPSKVKIGIGRETTVRDIKFGDNFWLVPVKAVTAERNELVSLNVNNQKLTAEVKLAPVRKWETNFVQISHTDIGYTRPQAEILAEHVRFIDYVLDYCDATDNYPDEAKFRWTCEGTWAVQEYFNSRPKSQIDRFMRRVKEGRIELTAMYYNFDEVPSEQVLASSLYPLKKFKQMGLGPVQVATQNDVNGIGWCFPEYFSDLGVKYLTMGVNLHKAVAPFDSPTYFWWQSPSGKRVLTYYGEHYMHGNTLGITGQNFEDFEVKLLNYLNKMERQGYKYDIMACEFLGIGGDNSAPSMYASNLVKQWNEKYAWPKVRLSLHKDYMSRIEHKYGSQLPTIQGAWPDWWTDGFASGAMETAAHRLTDASKLSTVSGLSLSKMVDGELPARIYNEFFELDNALLFYGEHTYGADASIDRPFAKETMEQRFVKASYAWEGLRRERVLREKTLGFLNNLVPTFDKPSITVYNMSSWERTGLVDVYIDYTMLPLGRKFYICDESGKRIKAQMTKSRYDGANWSLWVDAVPAYGYKKYFLYVEDSKSDKVAVETPDLQCIENNWYRISIDSNTGTITSVIDKDLGVNIFTANAKWKAGQFINEKFASRFIDANTMSACTRNLPDRMKFEAYTPGDVWDTYSFKAHTETGIGESDNLQIDFLVYNVTKRIDVRYKLLKKMDTSPEAVYVAFPFELPDAKTYFDVPAGIIKACEGQIQGTSNDWNTIQNLVSIRNQNSQIVLTSPEAPFVQIGDINLGRFKKDAKPLSNNIYSYVMNNYWTTNFNADQHGEFEWTYSITSMNNNLASEGMKFALESRVPMLSRAIPAGKAAVNAETCKSFLTLVPANVIVMNMQPVKGEDALLLQLRELDGETTEIRFSSLPDGVKVVPSNAIGETLSGGDLQIDGYETRFIKLEWNN